MEQNELGMVDLLEIYHARQLQNHILAQLRRLTSDKQHLPINDLSRRRAVLQYYEALLMTVAELLHQMGDRIPAD